MLNQEIKNSKYFLVIFFFLLFSCAEKSVKKYEDKSFQLIGKQEYFKIYNLFNDTLQTWKLNKILGSVDSTYSIEYADSLLCFNLNKNRMISCLLQRVLVKESDSDGLMYLYGEKIENQWYFFTGPSIIIPRSIIGGHSIHQPLSYSQLHNIALKEIYGGYLKSNGEINDAWFTSLFEGAGWANWDDSPEKIKNYTRKDYEQLHLKKVRGNWSRANKDSIKQLPINKNNLP